MIRRARWWAFAALFVGQLAIGTTPAQAAPGAPVLRVATTPTLGCVVAHEDDPLLSFFGTTFGDPSLGIAPQAACGTFVAVEGVLHIPEDTGAMFTTGNTNLPPELRGEAPPVLTPMAQSPVSGTGTDIDPYVVTTTVRAGTTGVEVVQTDSWTVSSETVQTRLDVFNRSRQLRTVSLYRAADCQANSFEAFGLVSWGRAACVVATLDGPGHDVARLVPGDSMIELYGGLGTPVVDLFGATPGQPGFGSIESGKGLRRTCVRCEPPHAADRTVALGWRLPIGRGRSTTVWTATTITTGPGRSTSTIEAHLQGGGAETVVATLTSEGAPLRSRTLRFLRDGAEVCRAITDRSGTATCRAPAIALVGDPAAAVLAGSATVDVMYDGDLHVRPSNTWIELGNRTTDPGVVPPAPSCLPLPWPGPNIYGMAPGAGRMILDFAEASCPSVRYAVYSSTGALLGALPGNGMNRLTFEFVTMDTGRLVLSRFRQPSIELFSAPVTLTSPTKLIG